MKKNKILSILLLTLAFTACKTKQTVVKPPEPATPPVKKEMPVGEMIKRIQTYQPAFSTAYVNKMQMDIKVRGRELTVGGTCQMVTDSAIHLSIQPFFGIELFKVEMTPKQIIVIDKTNKKFYENNYAFFRNNFGINVNFDAIQSLISNRFFLAGKKAYLNEDFSWKSNSPLTHTLVGKTETMKEEVKIDPALNRIVNIIIQTLTNDYTLTADYSDFKQFDKTFFPSVIDINATSKDQQKGNFKFMIEKVKFNEPLKMKSTNLDRYTRGDIYSILKK